MSSAEVVQSDLGRPRRHVSLPTENPPSTVTTYQDSVAARPASFK